LKPERVGRIDAELQKALAVIISRELKDPRVGFTTVTRVEVAQDLSRAKVYVSIIGDRHRAKLTLQALDHAAGFLRGELGRVVALRHTPELTFIEDRSTEKAIEMSRTLERIAHQSEPQLETADEGES
jgi:ribosome-binding factor A